MVVPFDKCIARPPNRMLQFPLTEHLEAVAADCGSACGTAEERLAFLAGLLHDAAKCHCQWQKYILGQLQKGPAHAPLGAALFAFCADQLIPFWGGNRPDRIWLRDLALDWTRTIYNHHSRLDDLDFLPPWEMRSNMEELKKFLEGCDMKGLFLFISSYFDALCVNEDQFCDWLGSFSETWERRVRFERHSVLRKKVQQQSDKEDFSNLALRLPEITSQLVRADRYHVGMFERSYLEPREAAKAIHFLESACHERAANALNGGANPVLVDYRRQVQKQAVERYRKNTDETFLTLLLPTGYGKTLTGLRVALEACQRGRCQRVIYVAPYLSILSQSALEIAQATGLEVFQHHHLSLAELGDDEDVEVLDTWQAPILATTFNQFFRALFPHRAQECLRMDALHGAFIIIDEPQIIDAGIWNVFLRALAARTSIWNCQVLFATATLPPLRAGLGQGAVALASPQVEWGNRFVIDYAKQPLTAGDVVDDVCRLSESGDSIAVVLNTVADAAQLYRLLKNSKRFKRLHCLTAMMLPGHKTGIIRSIRKELSSGIATIVVCTQILEAGVDLSFRKVLRALPVFPSIAQVAGRVNRHGEGKRATVTVFPFIRENEVDVRRYVYRSATALRQTDRLVKTHPYIREEDMGRLLNIYFQRCWQENRNEACLAKFELAAYGRWSELAGLQPFDGAGQREEIFVPWQNMELSPAMELLLKEFAPKGPEQLLNNYLNKAYYNNLTFLQKKRFNALLRQYIVSAPRKIAVKVAEQVSSWLWRLSNPKDYSPKTGLAHMLEKESDPACTII